MSFRNERHMRLSGEAGGPRRARFSRDGVGSRLARRATRIRAESAQLARICQSGLERSDSWPSGEAGVPDTRDFRVTGWEADLRAESPAARLECAATSVLPKRFGAKRHIAKLKRRGRGPRHARFSRDGVGSRLARRAACCRAGVCSHIGAAKAVWSEATPK